MTATITVHADLTATVETEARICRLPAYHPETLDPWGSEDEVRAFAEGISTDNRYMGLKALQTPVDPKAVKTAAINAERDSRIDAPVTFAGSEFQADPVSRGRIDRARISALAAIMGGAQAGDYRWHGQAVDFVWIALDDTRVPMDAQTTVTFGSAVAAREGLLVLFANDLKQAVALAADDAELDAIDIETGWPS